MNVGQTHNFIKIIYSVVFVVCAFLITVTTAVAQPTPTINYQGKLTTPTGLAVADGLYTMEFRLYTAPTGGTALWTETLTGANEVQVQNGLFSVMLGSTSPLTSVNFNQPLFLGVNIEGDGEMTPRKPFGTVPAAFEAQRVGGVASTSLLRNDQAGTASGLLTFTGGLISTASSTIQNLTTGTATTTNLVINGQRFSNLLGTGLTNNAGVLTVSTSSLGLFGTTSIDTSAKLAAILGDETGSGGGFVRATSPIFTNQFDLGSTGVRLSTDNDGAITFLGLSNGFDENLTLNLDDGMFGFVPNSAVFSSGTGLDTVHFDQIGLSVFSQSTTSAGSRFDMFNSNPLTSGTEVVNAQSLLALRDNVNGGDAIVYGQRITVGIGDNGAGETTVYGSDIEVGYTGVNRADISFGQRILAYSNSVGNSTTTGLYVNVFDTGPNNVTNSAIFMGGNVGIGTETPSQALTVTGNVRITGALFDSNNASGTLGQVLQSTGSGFTWVATSTLGFGSGDFRADGSVNMTDTLFLAQGALGTGGISFVGDEDTGIRRSGTDQINIEAGGGISASFVSTGLVTNGADITNLSIQGGTFDVFGGSDLFLMLIPQSLVALTYCQPRWVVRLLQFIHLVMTPIRVCLVPLLTSLALLLLVLNVCGLMRVGMWGLGQRVQLVD